MIRRSISSVAAAAVACLCVLHPALTEELSTQSLFSFLHQQALEAEKAFPREEWKPAQMIRVLQSKWQEDPSGMTGEYLQTLQADILLIASALKEPTSSSAIEDYEEACRDLDVKVKHARKLSGIKETLGAVIHVMVKAKRSGQEVAGYDVRCNPKRYRDRAGSMFPFNNPTNDAHRDLPPGNYLIWLEKGGVKIREKPVSIGDGDTDETIIFFID